MQLISFLQKIGQLPGHLNIKIDAAFVIKILSTCYGQKLSAQSKTFGP